MASVEGSSACLFVKNDEAQDYKMKEIQKWQGVW